MRDRLFSDLGCDRLFSSVVAGARRYQYFGYGCNKFDAVPLQISAIVCFPIWDAIAIRIRQEDNVGARHQQIIGSDDNVIIAVPRPDAVRNAIVGFRFPMRSSVCVMDAIANVL